MKKLVVFVLGLLVVAGVVLATLPARMLTDRLSQRQPALSAQGVSGTLWSGQAEQLLWSGVPLGKLGWRLSVLSVLQRQPQLTFELGGGLVRLQGQARRDGEALELGPVTGELEAGLVQPAIGIPLLRLVGAIDVELRRLRLDAAGAPEAADLEVTWRRASVTGLAVAELGTLRLRVHGERGRIGGQIGNGLDAALAVEGGFTLENRRYRAEIRLRAVDAASPVQRALSYIGQPDGSGGRILLIEGELL